MKKKSTKVKFSLQLEPETIAIIKKRSQAAGIPYGDYIRNLMDERAKRFSRKEW